MSKMSSLIVFFFYISWGGVTDDFSVLLSWPSDLPGVLSNEVVEFCLAEMRLGESRSFITNLDVIF